MEGKLGCPFCGCADVSTHFDAEQGFKYGYAGCDACGARGPEVRTQYDHSEGAPWGLEALKEWNRRPTPTAQE